MSPCMQGQRWSQLRAVVQPTDWRHIWTRPPSLRRVGWRQGGGGGAWRGRVPGEAPGRTSHEGCAPQALHAPSVCCVYLRRAELGQVPSCLVWLLPVSLKSCQRWRQFSPGLLFHLFVNQSGWVPPCPEEIEEIALISPWSAFCSSAPGSQSWAGSRWRVCWVTQWC